jgi:hypothetical protein
MTAELRETTLPAVVGHADWGCDPRKQQVAVAELAAGPAARPRYQVVSVDSAARGGADLFDVLEVGAGRGRCLVGFDFPIGLPRDYAAAVGVTWFPAFLDLIGSGAWREFAQVADRASDICLHRPFYPRRPGGTRRADLYAGLGLSAAQLRRRADGRDAETLFWTLGPKQAGKASLDGWRLLREARARGVDIALWPFDGSLARLLAPPAAFVVAETYPREYYRYIGVPPAARWSKRRRDDRLTCVPRLLAWADSLGVGFAADVRRLVTSGFGDGPVGEDQFDCVVGVLGMIGVVTGAIAVGLPDDDPAVATTEGWILGRAADPPVGVLGRAAEARSDMTVSAQVLTRRSAGNGFGRLA